MSGTSTVRYDVGNLAQWGRLIKSWATGLDYVTTPDAPQPPRKYWVKEGLHAAPPPAPATVLDIDSDGKPKPWCLPTGGPVVVANADGGTVALPFAVAMTIADYRTRVEKAGVQITSMPPEYTNVVIVQGSADTLVMRLPPKDMLQNSEDDLLNGDTYAFRSFYSQIYGGSPTPPEGQTAIMELHANRIGEYTLNNCM